MLIIHLLGLVMGVGTSIGFLFLGAASSKMEPDESKKFMLNSLALGRMGHIGITLLLISGFYLITPYWSSLTSRPLLMTKLSLVAMLVILLSIISVNAVKIKKGNFKLAALNKRLGLINFFLGIAIIILAVLQFK